MTDHCGHRIPMSRPCAECNRWRTLCLVCGTPGAGRNTTAVIAVGAADFRGYITECERGHTVKIEPVDAVKALALPDRCPICAEVGERYLVVPDERHDPIYEMKCNNGHRWRMKPEELQSIARRDAALVNRLTGAELRQVYGQLRQHHVELALSVAALVATWPGKYPTQERDLKSLGQFMNANRAALDELSLRLEELQ